MCSCSKRWSRSAPSANTVRTKKRKREEGDMRFLVTHRNPLKRHPLGMQLDHNPGHLVVPGHAVARVVAPLVRSSCWLAGSCGRRQRRRWPVVVVAVVLRQRLSSCRAAPVMTTVRGRVVRLELGLDAHREGGGGGGRRHKVAPHEQVRRDGVEAPVAPVRLGGEAPEGGVVVGVDDGPFSRREDVVVGGGAASGLLLLLLVGSSGEIVSVFA